MTSRRLNATAASLLGFLHEGPLTGWDLVAVAQDRIGDFWSLTQSQVYRELAAMAADGLVEAGERGRRDRRPYTITAAGRAAFARWVAHEPGPDAIRMPLLLSVMFGRHVPPGVMPGFVATHRAEHAARLDGYRRRKAEGGLPDAYAEAVLDFGIAYETAVLAWFDALPAQVSGGAAPAAPPPR